MIKNAAGSIKSEVPSTGISYYTAEVQNRVNGLWETIDLLEKTLSPFLSPAAGSGSDSAAKQASMNSSTRDALAGSVYGLGNLNTKIQDLIDRVDV